MANPRLKGTMMTSVSDMSIYLDVRAVESALLALRPELAGRVKEPEAGRPVLSVDVSGRPVVVALIRGSVQGGSYCRAWMISGGFGDDDSFWFHRTQPAVLAQAVVARVDAVLTGHQLASPWRWDEASTSPLTELADALDELGVAVTGVVAHNRCVAIVTGVELGLQLAPDSAGHYLDIVGDDRPEALRVSLRPKVGWTLERTLPGQAARLDLGRLLTGTATSAPGVAPDSTELEQIAQAVFRVLQSDPAQDAMA